MARLLWAGAGLGLRLAASQPVNSTTAPQLTTTTPGPAGCVVGLVVVVVLCKKYESIMVIDLAIGSEVYLVLELLNIILIGQFYCLVLECC